VRLDASRGMPANFVPRTVRFDPNPRTFRNRLLDVLAGASHRVFRSTLQGLNQSIVGICVSFNAYVDPLYVFQVIYQALTRQLTTG
jgi:hypothetical protein